MAIKVNGTTIDKVVYNGQNIDKVTFNGSIVFANPLEYLNFTGLDANGNMEGQQAFSGNIVAYAVGQPTITYELDEQGNSIESINYLACNGFKADFYGITVDDLRTTESCFVDKIISIPDTYEGLPITKILSSAFCGELVKMLGDLPVSLPNTQKGQGYFLEEVHLGSNIQELGAYCFCGCQNLTKMNFPNSIKNIKNGALANCLMGQEVFLPNSIEKLGHSFFAFGANKIHITSSAIVCENEYDHMSSHILNGYGAFCEFASAENVLNNFIFENTVSNLTGDLVAGTAKLVFKHSKNASLTLNNSIQAKNSSDIYIYSDNDSVNNYNWASFNLNPIMYPLSEWEGN